MEEDSENSNRSAGPREEETSESLVSSEPNGRPKIPEGWKALMGKDLLMKTITEPPENSISVQPQDTVVIDFEGRSAGDVSITDGPVFQAVTGWQIVIGEKDVLPCLEMCVRFMRLGETATVWSDSKYAYGPGQRRSDGHLLPAQANVCYTVTVREIKPDRSATAAAQIEMARMKKTIGNDIYTHECFEDGQGKSRAKQQYQRGADMMQYLLQTAQTEDEDVTEELLEEARQILLDCLNNIAALYLRNKEYKLAKEAAVKVLTHDPSNFKGLIRAAKAALLDPASSYEEVEAAIQAAAERSDTATDKDLQRLRADFKRRKQAYKQKSKEMFSKIGQSIGANDSCRSDSNGTSVEPGASSPAEEEDTTVSSGPKFTSSEFAGSSRKRPLLNWREWDWRNKILPYGFQLILPFIMYWYFTVLKQREQDTLQHSTGEQESRRDEF